jgi:hypothetical protein
MKIKYTNWFKSNQRGRCVYVDRIRNKPTISYKDNRLIATSYGKTEWTTTVYSTEIEKATAVYCTIVKGTVQKISLPAALTLST